MKPLPRQQLYDTQNPHRNNISHSVELYFFGPKPMENVEVDLTEIRILTWMSTQFLYWSCRFEGLIHTKRKQHEKNCEGAIQKNVNDSGLCWDIDNTKQSSTSFFSFVRSTYGPFARPLLISRYNEHAQRSGTFPRSFGPSERIARSTSLAFFASRVNPDLFYPNSESKGIHQ